VRKIVLYTLMSLDGDVDDPAEYFTSSPEPGQPPVFDRVMVDNEVKVTGTQDAVLLGRHMYDEWSRYWPTVKDDPFADFINNVKKYVVTSTPLSNEWHNAEAVNGPLEDVVRISRPDPAATSAFTAASPWRSRCSKRTLSTSCGWWSVRRSGSRDGGYSRPSARSAGSSSLSTAATPSGTVLLATGLP